MGMHLQSVSYGISPESAYDEWVLFRTSEEEATLLQSDRGATIQMSNGAENAQRWRVQLLQNGKSLIRGKYRFCISGGAELENQPVNFQIDSGPDNYIWAGNAQKQYVFPSAGEISEACYDFEVNEPIDGQRAVIELGKVEGEIALCAVSLRRCSSLSDGESIVDNDETPIQDTGSFKIIPTKNRGIGVNLATGLAQSTSLRDGDQREVVDKLYSMGARNFKLWSGTLRS